MLYDVILIGFTRGMPSYITDVLFVLSILLYFVLVLTVFNLLVLSCMFVQCECYMSVCKLDFCILSSQDFYEIVFFHPYL